jgi:cytidine deaminase
MKSEKRNILIEYEVYKWNEVGLSKDQELMLRAEEAARDAYAPYSGFRVGVAVFLEDGRIVTGSNQENAAYPLGLCAERVALFAAASQFPDKKILKISVAAKDKLGGATPVTPCGSCRQVMLEYEYKQHQPIKVLLLGPDHTILRFNSADALLPLGFNSSQLK